MSFFKSDSRKLSLMIMFDFFLFNDNLNKKNALFLKLININNK